MRDNRLWKPGNEGVQATFCLCEKCGEAYEAAYEHVCREKNSYPKTCGTCCHYIGLGDWSLCCDLMYDLCYDHTEACELYEYSTETVRMLEKLKRTIKE